MKQSLSPEEYRFFIRLMKTSAGFTLQSYNPVTSQHMSSKAIIAALQVVTSFDFAHKIGGWHISPEAASTVAGTCPTEEIVADFSTSDLLSKNTDEKTKQRLATEQTALPPQATNGLDQDSSDQLVSCFRHKAILESTKVFFFHLDVSQRLIPEQSGAIINKINSSVPLSRPAFGPTEFSRRHTYKISVEEGSFNFESIQYAIVMHFEKKNEKTSIDTCKYVKCDLD